MKTHPKHPSIGNRVERHTRPIVKRLLQALTCCGGIAVCGTLLAASMVNAQELGNSTSGGGATEVQNSLFTHQGQSFPVVNTASFRTAADIGKTESGSIQQVGLFRHAGGTCYACGTDSCGGSCGQLKLLARRGASKSCGSCGTACGGRCGRVSSLSCNGAFAGACDPCHPYRYVSVEALYMTRGDDGFSLSQHFGSSDFDYEWAPRVTLGAVDDCVHGYEASFVGPLSWDITSSLANGAGGINTLLIPGLPVPAASLSAFNDAVFQSQSLSADYHSFEASKTLVGWEVAKLLLGGRYINYDEEYNYFSQTATEAGRLRSLADNQLFGLQIGLDMLYPISKHGYSDVRMRAGGYLNSADSNVTLANAGSTVLNNGSSDHELAGLFEFGSGVRYQLGEILSVRAGVEVWYLTGVATAATQVDQIVRPTTGRQARLDDDVLFTGLSFGVELRY